MSRGSRVVPCGRTDRLAETDRYDEGESRFLKFAYTPKKETRIRLHGKSI
jgi:hypothetical protein